MPLVTIFEIAMTGISLLIFLILRKLNKSIYSPTIDIEISTWKIDTIYSVGMALVFFISIVIVNTPLYYLQPYFDQAAVIIFSLMMIPDLIKIIIREARNTFLFSPEEEIVDDIKKTTMETLKDYPFKPTFFDITRTGRFLWVDIYYKPDVEMISAEQMTVAIQKLNRALKSKYENCQCCLIFDA